MAELIAVAYKGEHEALEVRLRLTKLRRGDLLDLEDAVVATGTRPAPPRCTTRCFRLLRLPRENRQLPPLSADARRGGRELAEPLRELGCDLAVER